MTKQTLKRHMQKLDAYEAASTRMRCVLRQPAPVRPADLPAPPPPPVR